MADAGWTRALAALLLLLRAVDAVLGVPPSGLLDADPADCGGLRPLWGCVRRDLVAGLGAILAQDQYNVTPALAVERVRFADEDVRADSLDGAGLPALAATAIKVFETHALVWKLWPGMLHLRVFRDGDEGMDAALEIPPSDGSRTWGLGARRRLTMALLPIMYKMGVATTLLGALVFIALKTMFMVSILFVLAISSFAKHKLAAVAAPHHYAPPPHREVHVHVHADNQAHGVWHRYGGHGPGHGSHDSYQPVYPPYHSVHSGPDQHPYLEPTYYHGRIGQDWAGSAYSPDMYSRSYAAQRLQ